MITLPTPSAPLTLAAGHACWSTMVRQAGKPPISTLGLPGPGDSGLPCVVRSVTRAAGLPGIALLRYRVDRARLGVVGVIRRLGDDAGSAAAVDQHHVTDNSHSARVDLDEAAGGLDRQLHAGLNHNFHSGLEVVVLADVLVAGALNDQVAVVADPQIGRAHF